MSTKLKKMNYWTFILFISFRNRHWPVGHCQEQFLHVGINCKHCIVYVEKYEEKNNKNKNVKSVIWTSDFINSVLELSVIKVIHISLPQYELFPNETIYSLEK